MNIWPRFLRFLWEEEATRASPSLPDVGMPREPTGVPVLLQRITRWSVVSTVGVMLTAQIIGVRLIAPVDADTVYVKTCTCCCSALRKLCETQTTPPGSGANCPTSSCKNSGGAATPWPGGCSQYGAGTKARSNCCKQQQDVCDKGCPPE